MSTVHVEIGNVTLAPAVAGGALVVRVAPSADWLDPETDKIITHFDKVCAELALSKVEDAR